MSIVSLDQVKKHVKIAKHELQNDIVFRFFDKEPTDKRDSLYHRALYIGVLALAEDRLSAFLSKTSNELGTQLESLKIIFNMNQEVFLKSTQKGVTAEAQIEEFLIGFFTEKQLKDRPELTGNTSGSLHRNKTGDIVCYIDGNEEIRIVLECKFDKSVPLEPIRAKNVFKQKSDSAWSQLLESHANRDGRISIIVFDRETLHSSIEKAHDNVGFIPGVGFIAVIESARGDYRNLAIAYMQARDIAVNAKKVDLDKDVLAILMMRIIKDIEEIRSTKKLIESNIDNNKKILCHLEKSLLLMNFNQEYLEKFLQEGTLSKADFMEFYMGESVKAKYQLAEEEISQLYS